MSSRTVQIITADGSARVDSTNNALRTQAEVHSKIHDGEFFTFSATSDVNAAASLEILISVPATHSVHARFLGNVTGNVTVLLTEGPTTSAAGVAATAQNRRRSGTPPTANVTITLGPTVTADGTTLYDGVIPAGAGPHGGGGSSGSFEEWILKPDTDYLIRITNITASTIKAGQVMDFYEVAV